MSLSSKILTVKGYRSAFVKYKPTNVLLFIIFRLFITVSKCLPLNHLLNVSILIYTITPMN